MTLADRIQHWRKARNLSQRAIGQLVGVSGACIAQWESGSTTPTQANLQKFVESIELTMEKFYSAIPENGQAA